MEENGRKKEKKSGKGEREWKRAEKSGKERKPVAQRQEMVIGTLALLLYFVMVAVMGAGQRLWREPEEKKSCRIQVEYVRLSEPVLPAQGQPLRGLTGRGTDGQTDVRTDVQIPPILQDFVSSDSLRSSCPKSEPVAQRQEMVISTLALL